jgi:hypothetical protein
MPRYTVLWHTDATNDLAELWAEAIDRRSLTIAAAAVDRELNSDPISKGYELSEGLRVFVEPPLQILFIVREDDRVVEVLRLKLI